MNVTELIRGNLVEVQNEIREKCEEIADAIKSGKVKKIEMGDSHRKILFPVLSGLGIPYNYYGNDIVFVCYDQDKLKEYVDLI